MHRHLSLSIDAQLFTRFPRLRLGSFVALHLERASSSITYPDVQALWRTAAAARGRGELERIRPAYTAVTLATLAGAIALRHLVRLRGYDLDALPDAAITIRTANPRSDWFMPIGARPTDLPLGEDEVVHAAGRTVLSWAFTARESRQTCLCQETTCAVFVGDALTAAQGRSASLALRELRNILTSHGAVVSDVAFVHARAPHAELSCEDATVGS